MLPVLLALLLMLSALLSAQTALLIALIVLLSELIAIAALLVVLLALLPVLLALIAGLLALLLLLVAAIAGLSALLLLITVGQSPFVISNSSNICADNTAGSVDIADNGLILPKKGFALHIGSISPTPAAQLLLRGLIPPILSRTRPRS